MKTSIKVLVKSNKVDKKLMCIILFFLILHVYLDCIYFNLFYFFYKKNIVIYFGVFLFTVDLSFASGIYTRKTFTLIRHRDVREYHDWGNDFHSLICEGWGLNQCGWRDKPAELIAVPSLETTVEGLIIDNINNGIYQGSGAVTIFVKTYAYTYNYSQVTDILEYTITY